jgi:hypothetical protein
MHREAGDARAALASLAALRELDPSDPDAAQLASHLAGAAVVAASEEVRLANIAKLATTALLRKEATVQASRTARRELPPAVTACGHRSR